MAEKDGHSSSKGGVTSNQSNPSKTKKHNEEPSLSNSRSSPVLSYSASYSPHPYNSRQINNSSIHEAGQAYVSPFPHKHTGAIWISPPSTSTALVVSQPLSSSHFSRVIASPNAQHSESQDAIEQDVRDILSDMRRQYDDVHVECQRKSTRYAHMKESIRQADFAHHQRSLEVHRINGRLKLLRNQMKETQQEIENALINKKIYCQIMERIRKEKDLFRQRILKKESLLQRKNAELRDKTRSLHKQMQVNQKTILEMDSLEKQMEAERQLQCHATKELETALVTKKESIKRRDEFEQWRRDVASDAATEAFNASVGKLRKLYAFEKLLGNVLQKQTVEEVEKSQVTEDGFQKIREVTGLTDVMDIVHKFLNRDVEHEQLRQSAAEAEQKLEKLRVENATITANASGLTLEGDNALRRGLYVEVEDTDSNLKKALKQHAVSREKLQNTTLQLDQMKRWSKRINRFFVSSGLEEPYNLTETSNLAAYFENLQHTVEKLMDFIEQKKAEQDGPVQSLVSREYLETTKLLDDREFVKSICRVKADKGEGEEAGEKDTRVIWSKGKSRGISVLPATHHSSAAAAEIEDDQKLFQEDREQKKLRSKQLVNEALRKRQTRKGPPATAEK